MPTDSEVAALSVRTLRPDEAEAILDLWRTADATPSVTDTVQEVRRAADREGTAVLIAEVNGTIVGSVIVTFDGWRGNLYRLAVRPEQRRRGVARQLVAEAERLLSSWGARRVSALVERDHGWATSFWSAVGYAPDDRMTRFIRSLG